MAIVGINNSAITDGTHGADNYGLYGKWTVNTVEGVTYLSHDELDPTDTDAMLVSPGVKGNWVNGKKIVVGFNITTAGANVTTDFHIEGSMDGKNWVMIGSSLDDDIEPDSTGVQLYTVDLSDYTLPWYRLVNNDELTDQTNIKIIFLVSGINAEYAEGLGLDDTSDSFIGGVGKDPS
jgi:hypothetical protein